MSSLWCRCHCCFGLLCFLSAASVICCWCNLLLLSAAAICCCSLLLPSAAAIGCCLLLRPSSVPPSVATVWWCSRRLLQPPPTTAAAAEHVHSERLVHLAALLMRLCSTKRGAAERVLEQKSSGAAGISPQFLSLMRAAEESRREFSEPVRGPMVTAAQLSEVTRRSVLFGTRAGRGEGMSPGGFRILARSMHHGVVEMPPNRVREQWGRGYGVCAPELYTLRSLGCVRATGEFSVCACAACVCTTQLRMVKKPAKQVHRVFSCVVALTGWKGSEGSGHTGGTPPCTARTTTLPAFVTWAEIREMLGR